MIGVNGHLIKEELHSVDWNFENSDCSESIFSFHPYPAKFIPEIPKELILKFQINKKNAVFDPFCGSGTTLIVAQQLGYKAVGVDLNPIACLISEVKTRNLPGEFEELAQDILLAAKNNMKRNIEVDIPNLDHWFNEDVQTAISALLNSFECVRNVRIKQAFRFILSSIIVKVSNQESDTRYAAIKKKVSSSDVFEEFYSQCVRFFKVINSLKKNIPSVQVINGNILTLPPSTIKYPIGLVITSPPYPNAYEYWLYHKYRMWWLGYDPIKVKKQEIGARAHFFKKNHHTEQHFVHQMDATLHFIKQVVVKNAVICFVIGRSIIHGKIINNAAIIEKLAEKHGFNLFEKIERKIASKRKSFNASYGKIKEEQILIFSN